MLIHRNRNCASAYAAGAAITIVRTTVPSETTRLVTRLRALVGDRLLVAGEARVQREEVRRERVAGWLQDALTIQ